MLTNNTKRLGIAIITSGITTLAHATAPGFYMGGQIGMTNVHNTSQNVYSVAGAPPVAATPSNSGMGERFFMGAGINENVAIEAGYTHYAPSTYNPNPSNLVNQPTIRENGVDVTGKVMYPMQDFGLFGKAGVISIRRSLSGSLNPNPGTAGSSTQFHPLIGVGASYEITPNWVTDITWTRALKGGGGFKNADFIALGISYHFVAAHCGEFLC
jgi:hypothetical protein